MSFERACVSCERCFQYAKLLIEKKESEITNAAIQNLRKYPRTPSLGAKDFDELQVRHFESIAPLEDLRTIESDEGKKRLLSGEDHLYQLRYGTMQILESISVGNNTDEAILAKLSLGECRSCNYSQPKVAKFLES